MSPTDFKQPQSVPTPQSDTPKPVAVESAEPKKQAAPKKAAPKKAAPKKAAPKKAGPKKAAPKKAAPKKAAPKKAESKKAAPKKAAPKKAAPKKAAPKKAAPKKAAPKKAAPKKAAPKKAAPKKAAPKKAAPKKKSSVQVDPIETPNPNAMKFTLNQTVAETGSFSFNSADTEIAHPIAAAVMALEEVDSVFGVNDFITVSKVSSADWALLLPKVVEAIKGAA